VKFYLCIYTDIHMSHVLVSLKICTGHRESVLALCKRTLVWLMIDDGCMKNFGARIYCQNMFCVLESVKWQNVQQEF
jgi:hypothetical protein